MYFDNVQGTKSDLGRAISAEARARIAAQRLSGKLMAERMGVSQNYLSKRLRDVAPFTLDDIDLFVGSLDEDEDAHDFIAMAVARNLERVWIHMQEESEKVSAMETRLQGVVDESVLAADTSEEESEQ